MKKTLITVIAGILAIPSALLAQKPGQSELYNEVFAGYGAASVYYFTHPISHEYEGPDAIYVNYTGDPSSAGTFFVGYNRTISSVFNMGVIFSYMQLQTPAEGSTAYGDIVPGTSYDNLLNMIGRVKFAYVNKGVIQVYSGAAIGFTVDLNKTKLIDGHEYTDKKLKPAGELILMGVRGGRKLGGFVEFGFGTNGIVKGGVSYKFGKE